MHVPSTFSPAIKQKRAREEPWPIEHTILFVFSLSPTFSSSFNVLLYIEDSFIIVHCHSINNNSIYLFILATTSFKRHKNLFTQAFFCFSFSISFTAFSTNIISNRNAIIRTGR